MPDTCVHKTHTYIKASVSIVTDLPRFILCFWDSVTRVCTPKLSPCLGLRMRCESVWQLAVKSFLLFYYWIDHFLKGLVKAEKSVKLLFREPLNFFFNCEYLWIEIWLRNLNTTISLNQTDIFTFFITEQSTYIVQAVNF